MSCDATPAVHSPLAFGRGDSCSSREKVMARLRPSGPETLWVRRTSVPFSLFYKRCSLAACTGERDFALLDRQHENPNLLTVLSRHASLRHFGRHTSHGTATVRATPGTLESVLGHLRRPARGEWRYCRLRAASSTKSAHPAHPAQPAPSTFSRLSTRSVLLGPRRRLNCRGSSVAQEAPSGFTTRQLRELDGRRLGTVVRQRFRAPIQSSAHHSWVLSDRRRSSAKRANTLRSGSRARVATPCQTRPTPAASTLLRRLRALVSRRPRRWMHLRCCVPSYFLPKMRGSLRTAP